MTWGHSEGSSDADYAVVPPAVSLDWPKVLLFLHEMLGALEWCFQKELL